MGIDFSDAAEEPKLQQQAQTGDAKMRNIPEVSNPIISPESVNDGGGGGGGGRQKSFDEVMISADKNMNVVKQVMAQGGFTGPDKDKFDLIQAYEDWVKARNENINCPDQITKTSVRYTTLVNGKAEQNEIIKAYQTHKGIKESCDTSSDRVIKAAQHYIEIDRRVNENQLKAQNSYPVRTTTSNIEKFQVRGGTSVIEGFNFYNTENSYINNPTDLQAAYHQRLPRYKQSDRTTADLNKSILPWSQYYSTCASGADQTFCENAHNEKDKYINTINALFDKAEEKLKLYKYAIQQKSVSTRDASSNTTLNRILGANNEVVVNTAIENQKKEINLYKQQALYNYDQYNSLSFIEDMILFVYYAVFAIFIYMLIREFYSSGSYDKRNIIIVILLGIYPKYILIVVLWILHRFTDLMRMLGINNVSFWW
jgi:hypothetical protein